MKYIAKIVGGSLLLTAISAHAGFNGNTAHSRANCAGFNESITWNWNEYHWWEVKSIHFRIRGKGPDTHQIVAEMAYTWRSAAFDFWKDPAGGNADNYWVQGYHFYKDDSGKKIYDAYTEAGDCAIYDGWWDREKESNVTSNSNIIRKEYDSKPMVQGNTRVQELMDWHRDHPGEMPPLTEKEKYELFTKDGMPIPGTGATVVDNIKSFKMTQQEIYTANKFNSDQKTKGYYETNKNKAKMLLALPEISEKQYNERKSIAYDPHDTHLYEVKENLLMSYDYRGVPEALTIKVIGYSPESTFISNGWAGAVEFFVPPFGGVCAFHEVNILITKSSAYIPKEIVTYQINDKITTTNVVGTQETGFVYNVEWWDKKFKRSLDCASKEYSPAILQNTINLARKIDKA